MMCQTAKMRLSLVQIYWNGPRLSLDRYECITLFGQISHTKIWAVWQVTKSYKIGQGCDEDFNWRCRHVFHCTSTYKGCSQTSSAVGRHFAFRWIMDRIKSDASGETNSKSSLLGLFFMMLASRSYHSPKGLEPGRTCFITLVSPNCQRRQPVAWNSLVFF